MPFPDENPPPCATGKGYPEFLNLLTFFDVNALLSAFLNSICGLSFYFMEDMYEIILDAYLVPFALLSGGIWYPHDVIGDVSLDHLAKVVSALFLHCEGTIFLFPCTVILSKTCIMSIHSPKTFQ